MGMRHMRVDCMLSCKCITHICHPSVCMLQMPLSAPTKLFPLLTETPEASKSVWCQTVISELLWDLWYRSSKDAEFEVLMFPPAMKLQIHRKLFKKVSLSQSMEISCLSLMCAVKEAEGWCSIVHRCFWSWGARASCYDSTRNSKPVSLTSES